MILRTLIPFLLRAVKSLAMTALSPVLEKNVVKTVALDSTLVMSMSRLIALAFAGVTLREFWHTGIADWADATVGIATVLALPVMNALNRANPDEVLAVTKLLLVRLGNPEPSKFDDHRSD